MATPRRPCPDFEIDLLDEDESSHIIIEATGEMTSSVEIVVQEETV